MNKNNKNQFDPFANLSEQIINISKAGAFDVVSEQVQELKKENEELKKEIEVMKHNHKTAMYIALEYGFKQCEKGENMDGMFINYNKLLTEKR